MSVPRVQDVAAGFEAMGADMGTVKDRLAPRITDFATMQTAIDWLAGNGGEMLIPVGTHILTEPLNLAKLGPLGRRAVLRGEGQSSILQFNGVTGDAIYAGSATTTGSGLGWELRDFRIRGDSNAAMTGIFLENANSARLSRVWFQTMQDAIRMSNTFGVRVGECHATDLGRDFLRASKTYHLILRENGAFGIGGYFVNFTDAGPFINVAMTGNDVEVCGGLIKSAGSIHALLFNGNYFEQATGQVFDFDGAVRGEINANTLQMSGAQSIENFLGSFTYNHLFEIQFSWGTGSFPVAVGRNMPGTNSSVQRKPKKPATLQPGYTAQGAYETISYHKDITGRVDLQGNAVRDTGALATITYPHLLFTLEAGYRPLAPQTFVAHGTGSGPARIRVQVDGGVYIDGNGASDASVGVGGVSFMASTE